jgi:diamine N-acetyltransferase
MTLTLRRIDRANWRLAVALKPRPEQQRFVGTPLASLAHAFIRRYGDQYVYNPGVICDGEQIVGFYCTLCNAGSTDDFWVDDIMIDARYQGRGYGRAAMTEIVRSILRDYPQCAAVKLHCNCDNENAARLYLSLGFRLTGQINPEDGQPEYELSGPALRVYR